jgi:hypothetical protein
MDGKEQHKNQDRDDLFTHSMIEDPKTIDVEHISSVVPSSSFIEMMLISVNESRESLEKIFQWRFQIFSIFCH